MQEDGQQYPDEEHEGSYTAWLVIILPLVIMSLLYFYVWQPYKFRKKEQAKAEKAEQHRRRMLDEFINNGMLPGGAGEPVMLSPDNEVVIYYRTEPGNEAGGPLSGLLRDMTVRDAVESVKTGKRTAALRSLDFTFVLVFMDGAGEEFERVEVTPSMYK